MNVPDTFAFLLGDWSLRREITDHRTGERGVFDGSAELRAAGPRARYAERGQLRYRGYEGVARRSLDLIRGENGRVAVHFLDGRLFFDLDLGAGECQAEHPCRADRYELGFTVPSADVIHERWRVSGPAKDYEALTTWCRRPGVPVASDRIPAGR